MRQSRLNGEVLKDGIAMSRSAGDPGYLTKSDFPEREVILQKLIGLEK